MGRPEPARRYIQQEPSAFEVNPVYGKVPVLIHHGNPLSESSIILEYIDQIWKNNPLLPRDPYQRAQARFWAKVVEEKLLYPGWHAVCLEGEKQGRAVKVAIQTLEKIEEMLKGKRFFGGDKIGFLDLIIGFVSYMLPVWEEVASVKIFDPLKFPSIAAWKNNFINHDVIKGEYLPSRADMISYFQWRSRELMPKYASSLHY
ncbi:hypothetical protein DH2020_004676 [Rehmannia glutinosa]|uniref:glutathione transferase n=1 Tax=Rehmannia glutinosa TaxID=99300 RepID=A0ABR0XQ38_REHGL